MQAIASVQPLPKQQFTIVLDNTLYDISIIETNGCMSASITRGGEPEPVVTGWRCVAGQLVIPKDRENSYGNFMFLTRNNELPWWENFGTTQIFLYASPTDLAAVRGG
jgi:hypothetical protein